MERWAEIKETDGAYLVSDHGRVKSVTRIIACKNGISKTYHGKFIAGVNNGRGYLKLFLRVDGKPKRFYVHRLVAEYFVERPDGCDVVNHKDFNPSNNHYLNLEWTTPYGNTKYSYDRGRYEWTEVRHKNHKRGMDLAMGTPVIGTRISDGQEIYYTALNDCARDGFQPSCVCNCCKGIRETHKGYKWRYADAPRDESKGNQP